MTVFLRWLATPLIASFLTVALAAGAQERPLDAKLKSAFEKGQLSGLHNVLVIQDGEVLAERHFQGVDRRWGGTWDVRKHGPGTLHGLRSITKSVVGLLYGIALAEGKVPSLDQPLLAQFPEYPSLAADPKRRAILIRHALSMTMGTAWNEQPSYLDRKNSAIAMLYQRDQLRYVLDRPLVSEPGRLFTYNSGAVALIVRLIERGVGMSIDDFAKAKLFKPLNIRAYEWVRGADGAPVPYSGLRLNVHDLAKVGRVVIQDGKFNGRQIVPAAWLAESFKPRSVHRKGMKYGYLWWVVPKGWNGLPELVAGLGNGGQVLAIHRRHKLIVVIFTGNYNDPDRGKLPLKIMTEFVVPAVTARVEK